MFRQVNIILNYVLLYALLVTAPFLFFVLQNVAQFEFISIDFLWLFLGYILPYFVIFLFFNFLFPRRSKQLLISLAVLSFLQFYFYDLRLSLGIYNFKYSGHVALSLIVVVSLFIGYLSRWTETRNFLLIALLLNSLIYLPNLLSISSKQGADTKFASNLKLHSGIVENLSSNRRENIYYIVPDGMASPKTIQGYAELDVKKHIGSLVKKGFSVPTHSYSAYNMTYLTFASLFNMDYLVTEKTEPYHNRQNFYPAIASKRNKLVEYLISNGYKIVLVPTSWAGCSINPYIECLLPNEHTIFDTYSVSTFLKKSAIDRLVNLIYPYRSNKDDTIPTAIEYMKNEPQRWSDGGTFTIVHTLIPHEPFREENCSVINPFRNSSHKEKYRSSVLCALNRIEEITDFIIDNDPNAAVIIQSDHGVYLSGTEVDTQELFDNTPHSYIDARMSIFNAAYGCGADRAAQINQANIAKFVVECLKGTIIENKVDNRSFYGFYENHPQFGHVFQVKKR